MAVDFSFCIHDASISGCDLTADMDHLNKTADMIHARHRFLVTKTAKPAGDDSRGSENLASLLQRVAGLF